MYPAADILTTLNAIRIAPYPWLKRLSLLRAYLSSTTFRRLRPAQRAEFVLWGLKHLAPSWRAAEFLIKDIYVGAPYRISVANAATVFDVGANCGFATLFFKTIYPDAHIVAIEPQPRELDYITEAVALNNLQGVTILPLAVGTDPGKAAFITHSDNSVVSSMSESRTGQGKQLEVEVATLSSLLPNRPLDILKLDIEGAEVGVLKELADAKALTPERIRNIVMEYHRFDPTAIAALPEILSLLDSSGYDYALDAHASRYSTRQDILVYCKGKS